MGKCTSDISAARGTLLYLNVDKRSAVCRMKLAGMRRFAHQCGWRVVPIYEEDCADVRALLAKWRPAGCVVECGWGTKRFPLRIFGRTPTVYLDCRPGMFGRLASRVVHDNSATVTAAAKELLRLHLPHYAFVGWPVRVFWSTIRERLFAREIERFGRRCAIFRYAVRRGHEDAWRQRLHEWAASLPVPCGVLAANDQVAAEVARVCGTGGLRIPEDVAVLGIDNDGDICLGKGHPPLSSIQIDFEEAGYRAAERLATGKRPGDVTFGCMAVISRQSTRNFSRMRSRIVAAMEMIRRRACEGLTAMDVLRFLGGSRRAVETHFRESVGRSILAEIQSVRIERVFYYLERTDVPVESLADFCGYPTAWALRKAFRKAAGMSMRTWRARSRAIREHAANR